MTGTPTKCEDSITPVEEAPTKPKPQITDETPAKQKIRKVTFAPKPETKSIESRFDRIPLEREENLLQLNRTIFKIDQINAQIKEASCDGSKDLENLNEQLKNLNEQKEWLNQIIKELSTMLVQAQPYFAPKSTPKKTTFDRMIAWLARKTPSLHTPSSSPAQNTAALFSTLAEPRYMTSAQRKQKAEQLRT